MEPFSVAGFDVEGAVDFLAQHAALITLPIAELYVSGPGLLPEAARGLDALTEEQLVALAAAVYDPQAGFAHLPAPTQAFLQRARQGSLLYRALVSGAPAPPDRPVRRRNERQSDKKRHEVERLSRLIRTSGAPGLAVDFGAGQGYLSQALADAGWEVVALERDDGQCHGSLRRQTAGGQRPFRVERVNIGSATPVEVVRALHGRADGVCYCALHACGSLSIDQIRLFREDSAATLLANVGCCYNLMGAADVGLSQRLQPLRHQLGWLQERSARMLACQAPWRWAQKPAQQLQAFASNHYRALFQAYVLPHLEPAAVSVGHVAALGSFQAYTAAALGKLQLGSPPALDYAAIEARHPQRRLAVLWTLRALLGPVIESVLLLDRLFWLQEAHPDAQLVPLFDPVLSPRNFVLLARKIV